MVDIIYGSHADPPAYMHLVSHLNLFNVLTHVIFLIGVTIYCSEHWHDRYLIGLICQIASTTIFVFTLFPLIRILTDGQRVPLLLMAPLLVAKMCNYPVVGIFILEMKFWWLGVCGFLFHELSQWVVLMALIMYNRSFTEEEGGNTICCMKVPNDDDVL